MSKINLFIFSMLLIFMNSFAHAYASTCFHFPGWSGKVDTATLSEINRFAHETSDIISIRNVLEGFLLSNGMIAERMEIFENRFIFNRNLSPVRLNLDDISPILEKALWEITHDSLQDYLAGSASWKSQELKQRILFSQQTCSLKRMFEDQRYFENLLSEEDCLKLNQDKMRSYQLFISSLMLHVILVNQKITDPKYDLNNFTYAGVSSPGFALYQTVHESFKNQGISDDWAFYFSTQFFQLTGTCNGRKKTEQFSKSCK